MANTMLVTVRNGEGMTGCLHEFQSCRLFLVSYHFLYFYCVEMLLGSREGEVSDYDESEFVLRAWVYRPMCVFKSRSARSCVLLYPIPS